MIPRTSLKYDLCSMQVVLFDFKVSNSEMNYGYDMEVDRLMYNDIQIRLNL